MKLSARDILPGTIFGRVEAPPSVQRLLGLRWLLPALPASLFGLAVDNAAMAQLTGG